MLISTSQKSFYKTCTKKQKQTIKGSYLRLPLIFAATMFQF